MKYPLLEQYNSISRISLKYNLFNHKDGKDGIADRLKVTDQDNHQVIKDKLKIYALLIKFRYHLHINTFKSENDKGVLEVILGDISDVLKKNKNITVSLEECMAFVKNDGYIVKRNITAHFKSVLLELNEYGINILKLQIDKNNEREHLEGIKQFVFEKVGIQFSESAVKVQKKF